MVGWWWGGVGARGVVDVGDAQVRQRAGKQWMESEIFQNMIATVSASERKRRRMN